MASLFERYRPSGFDAVLGQDKAVALLQRTKAGGNAYWLAGPSGSGKTTLARILAAKWCESWHVDEIDAQDCTMDYLRAIEHDAHYRGMGEKHGKCWIVNEAHGLRGAIVSRFLTLIEQLPDHAFVVFTTTTAGQRTLFELDDACPFLARCLVVPMAWHELAPEAVGPLTTAFAKRAMEIAQAEGLDGGQPLAAYERLALECKHSLRHMLSRIEAGEMLKGGSGGSGWSVAA
jgi:replication-associated recombination protein RarA